MPRRNPSPRKYGNENNINSWNYDNSGGFIERQPYRGRSRSPYAGNSNTSRHSSRDYRGASPIYGRIQSYDESKPETPPVPTTANQNGLPPQDSKAEIEDLKSKLVACETSNKTLRTHMAFLFQDNSFLTSDNASISSKLKDAKEELRKVQEDNLGVTKTKDELNLKHEAMENSFVDLKNNNVDLFKKVEEKSRIIEQLEVQKKSYKADLEKMTKQYEDVLQAQSGRIKEEHSTVKLIAENVQLKHQLKSSEFVCAQTTSEFKMKILLAVETLQKERTKGETLNAENEELKNKIKVVEDESAETTKELKIIKKKNVNFKSKNNQLTKEIEELKEKSSEINKEKLKVLSDQIKDLKMKVDKSDGEIFQLKGDLEKMNKEKFKLKHRCREQDAQNKQLQEVNENLEIQNKAHVSNHKQLKSDCDSHKEKNEKLQTEVNKLKTIIPGLRKDMLRRLQELDDTMEAAVEESEPKRTEIHPNSDVYCDSEVWESISECSTANSFCKKLLVNIFENEDLIKCSFKGMGSETGPRRPALDPRKVDALTECVLKKFPSYTKNEITHSANAKMNALRIKSLREKSRKSL